MPRLQGENNMKVRGENIVRGHYRTLPDGEIKFVQTYGGGDIYAKPRKDYVRKHPYPTIRINDLGAIEHICHFKALAREKTAIIMLRNKGYSMTHLSKAFGRSTSWIFEILKNAKPFKLIHIHDNRKLPRRSLLLGCRKRLYSLLSWMKLWQPFIFGEEGEPP
jgi:hypothetical protein